MKKVVWVISVLFAILLIAGVIAEGTNYYICFSKNIDCKKAKESILDEKDKLSSEMKGFLEGRDNSKKQLDLLIDAAGKEGYDVSSVKHKLDILVKKFERVELDYKEYLVKIGDLGSNSCDIKKLSSLSNEIDNIIIKLKDDSKDVKDYAPEVSIEIDRLVKSVNKVQS